MEPWLNQPFDADALPAGPDADWRLLHHVLDWKRGAAGLGQPPYVFPGGGAVALWPVSTDPTHAERVAGLLRARGFVVEVAPDADRFRARVAGPAGSVEVRAETTPLAVTRAVLKAMLACIVVKG